tara:strand:- start:1129 stop:1941 length:813 start_codon:yes stop_codon:yes gene_type:complete
MTIKRVTIYGDSFADPNWRQGDWNREKEHPLHETWYETLAKQYEYKNFAVAGTGPHYSMKEFYSQYEQFNEKDLVIWILSGEERIQFHLPDEYYMRKYNKYPIDLGSPAADNKRHRINLVHDICWHFEKQEMSPHGDHSTIFFKTYKDHMSYAMKTFEREVVNSNKKNEAFLYTISRIQKCKICIFILRYNDSYMKTSFNDDSFYIHPQSLDEFFESLGDAEAPRRNHFSEPNHKIMYKIIDNFVQGMPGVFPQRLILEPDHKTERFIYD